VPHRVPDVVPDCVSQPTARLYPTGLSGRGSRDGTS
jgi:hypothetical protein